MEVTTIQSEPRTARGRNQIARLREQGKVPAVVYGLGTEPDHIALNDEDVMRELRKHHRVFQLEVGGKPEPVYLQDVQYDPVTDYCLHIDFLRIDMSKPLPVDVELTFLGVPAGQSKGGIFVRDAQSVRVQALPAKIPHEITVKIGHVEIGTEIYAKDLEMPEGCTLDMSGDTPICHMHA
jgi:large subunit ribosomal protein L25